VGVSPALDDQLDFLWGPQEFQICTTVFFKRPIHGGLNSWGARSNLAGITGSNQVSPLHGNACCTSLHVGKEPVERVMV